VVDGLDGDDRVFALLLPITSLFHSLLFLLPPVVVSRLLDFADF